MTDTTKLAERIEALGKAVGELSGELLMYDAFDNPAILAAYEKVQVAFSALRAQEARNG